MESIKAFFVSVWKSLPERFGDFAFAHPKTIIIAWAASLALALLV